MPPSSVFLLLSGDRHEGVQREQVGGRGWNQILVSLVSWARWFCFVGLALWAEPGTSVFTTRAEQQAGPNCEV